MPDIALKWQGSARNWGVWIVMAQMFTRNCLSRYRLKFRRVNFCWNTQRQPAATPCTSSYLLIAFGSECRIIYYRTNTA